MAIRKYRSTDEAMVKAILDAVGVPDEIQGATTSFKIEHSVESAMLVSLQYYPRMIREEAPGESGGQGHGNPRGVLPGTYCSSEEVADGRSC